MSKANPKVYFALSFLEACYYVRCLIPMREGGWDGDRTSLRIMPKNSDMQAQAVLDADIVVFHRPNDDRSFKIAEILRSQGKKIVYENDDTYKHLDNRQIEEILGKLDTQSDAFIKKADLVTCSTEFLAQEYRKLNKNVIVLPNCVDPEDWPEPLRNEGDKVRIGIIGSVGTNNDCAGFVKTLDALNTRNDVQLVLYGLPSKDPSTLPEVQAFYGGEYAFWDKYNIEWQPFTNIANYMETLNDLKLDLMVIPRKDDYFNHCKSNIKFLEASMLEIPVIAQGFKDNLSPYEVDKDDAEHMVIIKDNSEWLEAIDILVKNKNLRKEIGEKAHKYVMKKYSITNNISKWETAYKNLL